MFKWSRVSVTRMSSMPNEKGFLRPTRVPYKVLYSLLFTLILVIIVLLLPSGLSSTGKNSRALLDNKSALVKGDYSLFEFNRTYPLTSPTTVGGVIYYRIGLVADQDEKSKVDEKTWHSWFKTGTLGFHRDKHISVKWDPELVELRSHISEKGRGVELSELVVFNGRLYTVDDRTGIVFEILQGRLVPWVILEDGPGTVDKGFKAEWMTTKDQQLYVGGLGKEWTTQGGEYLTDHPQYVKVVSALGHVEHRPWASVYSRMKDRAGIQHPGYIIHESACWSDVHRKWFFLPRRASHESYNDILDESRATNLLITADEAFADINISTLGPLERYRGFSSFKFLPGTGDSVIVATKSEENKGRIATYMVAYDLQGHVLMKEQKVGDVKFEGIEFI